MKAIRVVQRAAAVLRALERRTASSLVQLHRDTRIPKPTLLRLLAALESERLVWRAMADGLYRTRVLLRRQRPAGHPLLAEVAAPHLEALRRRVVWPSDLTVRRGDWMVLIETSRRASTLAMHRDAVGARIDIRLSAVGRAYLAFCPAAEREGILARLEGRSSTLGAMTLLPEGLARALAHTRERGYAVRDPRFRGLASRRREIDDGLAAIAVPITDGAGVFGCLNLVWPRRLHRERDMAERHLADLKVTASNIAAAVAKPRR